MKKPINHGFTLVELLVVIAILSILLSVGLSAYASSQRLSRDAKRKTDLEQVRIALEIYKSENGSYPVAATGYVENGSPSLKTALSSPVPYINSNNFPHDPRPNRYYYYYKVDPAAAGSNKTYVVCGYLEDKRVGVDADCGVSGAICSSDAVTQCNYGVTQP